MTYTEKDNRFLESFCASPRGELGFLSEPFSLGDLTCATDGKQTLFRPGPYPRTLDKKHVTRLMLEHLDVMPTAQQPLKALDIRPVSYRTCPECKGNGDITFSSPLNHYTATCKTCDGDGTIEHRHIISLTENNVTLRFDSTTLYNVLQHDPEATYALSRGYLYFVSARFCGLITREQESDE
tara:strand:+ start:555 stop:1100 length:546 start_codon:yes stop_codon:yes gene_type:complete